jgi:hypothetical protein
MTAFTQTEPAPWLSGQGAAAGVLALSPEALSARYGLRFVESADNLDAYDSAAIRMSSGRRFGLLRYRGSPSRGTEVHADSTDDLLDALREFLDAFELSADDLVWVRQDVPLDHLRLAEKTASG